MKLVWNNRCIYLGSKIRLIRSLSTSIFLCSCESSTLTAKLKRRIRTMEMRCYSKIVHISCKDQITHEEVCANIQQAIGPHEDLIIVKRRTQQWYGHVSRSSCLAKTILQGTLKRERKARQIQKAMARQHQGMCRLGIHQVPEGSGEHRKMEETSCEVICSAPTTPRLRNR